MYHQQDFRIGGPISTINHMFGRVIWDKLPDCIFGNLEISKFSKITRMIYPKNCPNQTCDYWLITPNQQTCGYWLITPSQKTLCIETNIS